jgi:citrate synthase
MKSTSGRNTTFEEVAHLLWDEELPNRERDELKKGQVSRDADTSFEFLKTLPLKTQPMDALCGRR